MMMFMLHEDNPTECEFHGGGYTPDCPACQAREPELGPFFECPQETAVN